MVSPIGFTQLLILAAAIALLYRIRQSLPESALSSHRKRHISSDERTQRYRLLFLELTEIALAAVFFLVGGAKLIGQPDMIALFQDIGVGQWLRFVTGGIEVTGAALLIVPLLSGASAILLGVVMIVATLIELFVLHRPPMAALACLTAHTFVAWSRVTQQRPAFTQQVNGTRPMRFASAGSIAERWRFPRNTRVVPRRSVQSGDSERPPLWIVRRAASNNAGRTHPRRDDRLSTPGRE